MPTKISKSPFTMPPAPIKPGGGISTGSVMPSLKTPGGGAAGAVASAANPLGTALMVADMAAKGFTAGKEAKEAGASTGGAIVEGFLGTVGLEGLYEDKGIKERRKAEELVSSSMSKTEEQIAKNKAALTMTGKPLKMLTGVSSPMTYKMSAAQYKSAVKMSEISGAAPLQSNAFYASLNAAKEKGSDTFDVGGKTFNVK